MGYIVFTMFLGVCWIQRYFGKKEWENGGEKKVECGESVG